MNRLFEDLTILDSFVNFSLDEKVELKDSRLGKYLDKNDIVERYSLGNKMIIDEKINRNEETIEKLWTRCGSPVRSNNFFDGLRNRERRIRNKDKR